MKTLVIPKGYLAASSEDEAARRRKELREKLLRGEEVKVTPRGEVKSSKGSGRYEEGIIVPEGKLASFYWYERDPELLEGEKEAMRKYFPQFKLEKLSDGRLSWIGEMKTDLRRGGSWYLQAIYENSHPDNSTYGGSIKVYSIEPDLEESSKELGESIPHTLTDSSGHLYICTARPEDVKAGNIVTSAASSLAWAAKWIAAFELWMAGDLSTSEFEGHDI